MATKKKLTGKEMKTVKAGREISLKKYEAKKLRTISIKVPGKLG